MQSGKILIAQQSGAFVIKLTGDVRLSFCSALDEFFERMFATPHFASVIIDLCEAENIDSTTLGQLAKLAITAKRTYNFVPVILSTNPNITRILRSMGFERVFDIRQQRPQSEATLAELPMVEGSESAVRETVLDAHRVLMGMNEKNHAQFQELVCALEATR
ncbi:MAG TPA: STAS domain-containing protein [Spongiibacteraceae bacterium]|nr:STAS domain-containing protein [Spongiibacteraceae bacterium]